MKRNSLVAVLIFLAGLGIGYFARSAMGANGGADTHAADLAGIEKLHRADIEATLTQDPSQLTNLWSEDCVRLGVPGPAIVGRKAMREVYEKFRAEHPDFKMLNYVPAIQDVQVADGWAIEWVYYEATFTMSPKDHPVRLRRKGLRVLKRQSDGSWKFSRDAETD